MGNEILCGIAVPQKMHRLDFSPRRGPRVDEAMIFYNICRAIYRSFSGGICCNGPQFETFNFLDSRRLHYLTQYSADIKNVMMEWFLIKRFISSCWSVSASLEISINQDTLNFLTKSPILSYPQNWILPFSIDLKDRALLRYGKKITKHNNISVLRILSLP